MPLTGTVDTVNARIDLFVDWVATAGTQLTGTLWRRVGSPDASDQYVRGLFGSTLLGEQAYVSDHEAPLDEQVWYRAVNNQTADVMTAGPFTIPSSGNVWIKDPGRPWADLRLDLCATPDRSLAVCPDPVQVWDTFSRTTANGWGSTEAAHGASVQAWANAGGAASNYSVSGGTGRHSQTAVDVSLSTVTPLAASADQDVTVSWRLAAQPLTDSQYVFVTGRYTDTTHSYFARIQVAPTGVMTANLRKRNVAETQLGAAHVIGFAHVPGTWYRTRFVVIGNVLRTRTWPASGAEPTEWQLTAVDSDLITAGSVGVRSLVGAASTSPLPVLFEFDDFQALDATPAPVDNLAWVGFRDKVRAADAGLFPVLDRERPADVYARRKDITTSCSFLTRSLAAIDAVYDLHTAGGPLLFQVPDQYGMNRQYGQKDRYFQPGDLNEAYISEDQRRPLRLWSEPLTAVDLPVGLPQGTDTANWCAYAEQYPTFAQLTATGLTWGQIAQGQGITLPFAGLYDKGTYTDEGA